MTDTTTTEGAPLEGIAKLLGIGAPEACDEPLTPDEERARALEALLAAATDPMQSSATGPFVAGCCPSAVLQEGSRSSVAEVLLDERVSLTVLKGLKRRYKDLSRHARSESERLAATAVYFAAIAGALLSHEARISGYSFAELAGQFHKLAGVAWVPPDLAAQFDRARSAASGKAAAQDRQGANGG